MSEFLPIELDAESVRVAKDGPGWGFTIETREYGEIYLWTDSSDPVYEQLREKEVIKMRDGKLEAAQEIQE